MCGIGMFWAKESTLSFKQYDALFLGAERRGKMDSGLSS